MQVFLVKITDPENIGKVYSKDIFTHEGIATLEKDIVIGAPVFLYFGGDKKRISWEQGLVGVGKIIKTPYEKGYDAKKPKNFRIDIKPEHVLDKPLSPKFTKLHPQYQDILYDVPYVGANHIPSQAIAQSSGKGAEALFRLLQDISPNSVDSFNYSFLKKTSNSFWVNFIEFLNNCDLSEKSISNYKSGVKSVCSWYGLNIEDLFQKNSKELNILLDKIKEDLRDIKNGRMYSAAINKVANFLEVKEITVKNKTQLIKFPTNTKLPKPFILLAGISGTGKTRFVSKQAEAWGDIENDCLVPVRPDWHEPSDLLGYISRINGTRYIATDFLKFMIKAWVNAIDYVADNTLKLKVSEQIVPFWLCLDEMNLAPVEQYFADYLSLLESRKWDGENYSCKPILNSSLLQQLNKSKTDGKSDLGENDNSLEMLWYELFDGVECEFKEQLCSYFLLNGIAIPPNLIVAGTVNMDETAHGFSRKVIDRAFTLDFQEFFPNDFDCFFDGQIKPKVFSFSSETQLTKEMLHELVIDQTSEGASRSIEFLKKVNAILLNTPYQLAYRALNELLLSVYCIKPSSNEELLAVWDDFLMQKILPRIEGDTQKLKYLGDSFESNLEPSKYGKASSLLHKLYSVLDKDDMLGIIWNTKVRPDLLREFDDAIKCRSKEKLEWMIERLKSNHFTDFWV